MANTKVLTGSADRVRIDSPSGFVAHIYQVEKVEETDTPCFFFYSHGRMVAGFNATGLKHDFAGDDARLDAHKDREMGV